MAERLTIQEVIEYARQKAKDNKNEFYTFGIQKCKQCAEEHEQLAEWLEKLKYYEDLEEQGRLITLPCKIGDTVWNIRWWDNITESRVIDGETYFRHIMKHKVTKSQFSLCDYEELGKTVFLTKKEAEAALEGEDNK